MRAAIAGWPAGRLLAQEAASERPRHKVSAAALHQALSARFPLKWGVQDLLELQVSAPRLHLLPARNRLGAGLQVQASGPALQQEQSGELDLTFSLRYEAADRTVRAHQPEILALHLPGLAPEAAAALRKLLAATARESLGDFVLHRFSARELALADTMGFEPERLAVVDDGLVILFGPRAGR
jgi:hypothetical protein